MMPHVCLDLRCRPLFRAWAAGLIFFLGQAGSLPHLWAQSARSVNPSEFGFDLPSGVVRPSQGQSVTTADTDGKPVIARLQVAIGEGAIVMLPDGQLVARKK